MAEWINITQNRATHTDASRFYIKTISKIFVFNLSRVRAFRVQIDLLECVRWHLADTQSQR